GPELAEQFVQRGRAKAAIDRRAPPQQPFACAHARAWTEERAARACEVFARAKEQPGRPSFDVPLAEETALDTRAATKPDPRRHERIRARSFGPVEIAAKDRGPARGVMQPQSRRASRFRRRVLIEGQTLRQPVRADGRKRRVKILPRVIDRYGNAVVRQLAPPAPGQCAEAG